MFFFFIDQLIINIVCLITQILLYDVFVITCCTTGNGGC
jgi:hypothetical protein